MHPLERLHHTLVAAEIILDNAAGQVRDAALAPTNQHIHSIGTALASIFEIQHAIYKIKPELEPKYEEEPEKTRAANRRLGETLIAAYDLADSNKVPEALALLHQFASDDPSEYHRGLAAIEAERLSENYDA
jgi:hypothetical protein